MSILTALRAALAAEQAVVYGYGVLGAQLSGKSEKYAAQRLTIHQQLRDQLASAITGLGVVAPPAQPAYRLPFPVTDADSARRLAAQLESGATGAAWDLAAAATAGSGSRALAVGWLTDSAVAAVVWGAMPTALPGRPS